MCLRIGSPRSGGRWRAWRRLRAAGASLLLALSFAPFASVPAAAQATSFVSEVPPLNNNTVWTNAPFMSLQVDAANTVAGSVYVTFEGGPVPPAGPSVATGPAQVQLNYNLLPPAGSPPQPVAVAYTVSGQTYSDTALLGLDTSIVEPGAPSATSIGFTLFGHAGAAVDPTSIGVLYAGSDFTPSTGATVTADTAFPGAYRVSVAAAVSGSMPIVANYRDTSGNEYQASFQPSADTQWLQGTVVDGSGQPVAGAQVFAFGGNADAGGSSAPILPAYTGADGGYVLPLPAGTTGGLQVQVQPLAGQAFVAASASVASVSATGATAVPTITLPAPALTVTGVVRGASGTPLSNAFVNLFPAPQEGQGGSSVSGTGTGGPAPAGGSAQTGAAGAYTINLAQAGSYDMMVQPPFGSDNTGELMPFGPTLETLQPGATNCTSGTVTTCTVDVTLSKSSATVTGTVYFQGAPLADAQVMATTGPSGPNAGPGGFAFAQTDSGGNYTLNLGAGTWQIQVSGFVNTPTPHPLQGLQVQQSVSPSGVLSTGGSLVVGSSTGAVTDDITLVPYAAAVDVEPTVGCSTCFPTHAQVFATQGAPGGSGASPSGPGLFASDTQNSDGTANTNWLTQHHLHLFLAAGTWTLGVAEYSAGRPPRFYMLPPVSVAGSGSAVTLQVPASPNLTVTPGSPPVVAVTFPTRDQTVSVSVYDSSGQPVPGALVGAFRSNGDFIQANPNPATGTPVTASDGVATLNLTRARWRVGVYDPQYGFAQPQLVDTTVGANSYSLSFDLGVQRPDTLSGVVTFNGNPVPGAQIVASQPGQPSAYGVSDPFGNYTVNVTDGTWSLSVRAHGFDTSTVAPVTTPTALGAGNRSETVNLDISAATQRNITVSGTVLDAGGVDPVGGATVTATLAGRPPVTTVSDSDGTWTLHLSPGAWTLGAEAPGYTPSQPLSETVGSTGLSNVSLTLGSTLADTIVGSVDGTGGAPLENAVVTAVSTTSPSSVYQGLTAADGSFSIPVADGSYNLRVHAAGYIAAGTSVPVSVSGGATADVPAFQLSAGISVGGTVTIGGGAAPAGVEVDAVSSANPDLVVVTTTDSAGGFSFGLASGTWTLTAYEAGHAVSSGLTLNVGSTAITGTNLTIS